MNLPNLVVGDGAGHFFKVNELNMAGMGFIKPAPPKKSTLIALPRVSQLYVLPGRVAMGYDPDLNKFVQIREYRGVPVYPVAAVLSNDYLQGYRPAYSILLDAPRLPNISLAPVGMEEDTFYVPARQYMPEAVEKTRHFHFMRGNIDTLVNKVSRHLENTGDTVVYFYADAREHTERLTTIIKAIRKATNEGAIQIFGNAVDKEIAQQWLDAGLNQLTVALNSAQPEYYERWRSRDGFRYPALIDALTVMQDAGKSIGIEYQIFPGLTDHPSEIEALEALIKQFKKCQFKLKNLAIDPDWYMDELMLFHLSRNHVGMNEWFKQFAAKFPGINLKKA